MKYTTIVAATASEAAPLQYLGKSWVTPLPGYMY